MDLLWNSASLRLSCAVAFSRCAWATLRFAWAWVRLLRGMRGSILARSVPLLTSSPVWTGISRISPEAFDFTLSVRIGWIAPEAVAVTTMSRRATGTSEYGGAVSTLWQAAAPPTHPGGGPLGRLRPAPAPRPAEPGGASFVAGFAPPESASAASWAFGKPPAPVRRSRRGAG